MNFLFKALSSPTRIKMLKMLMKEEIHVSALAKKLGISVPVTAKHIKMLEKAGLIERKEIGRSHVLKVNSEQIYEVLNAFTEVSSIKMPKDKSILDALKLTCNVRTKRISDKELLISIDGKEGYYLYEVNGDIADVPMNSYKIKKDSELKLKKLIPITEKIIKITTR